MSGGGVPAGAWVGGTAPYLAPNNGSMFLAGQGTGAGDEAGVGMDRCNRNAHGGAYDDPGYPSHLADPSAAPAMSHGGPSELRLSAPTGVEGNESVAMSAPAPNGSPALGPTPVRKRRHRMITSCLECRRRKLKCDKREPTCAHCAKSNHQCLYLSPKVDDARIITAIKDRTGSLHGQIERDVVHRNSATTQTRMLARDVVDEYGDDYDPGPRGLGHADLTYDDDGEMDALIDLGIRVGKMRITERVGGMSRPRLSEEVTAAISGQPLPAPATRPFEEPSAQGLQDEEQYYPPGYQSREPMPDYLRPSATFIPPCPDLLIGQQDGSRSLEMLLPTRDQADRLMERYFESVHPVARCVHGPTLQAAYLEFWRMKYDNVEPRPSLQALIFATLFSAGVSTIDEPLHEWFGWDHQCLYKSFKLGTETALSKANFLRTTRVETLQAFIMYLVAMCRDEVSRAHSVLVGAAIRMAECMGLHRDGETYGLNPLDTHVRRLLWHQLCWLDIRTCEAQGPRPAIRRDEYDTKLPLNCDEAGLSRSAPFPAPAEGWTPTLLPLIRFEINEMIRVGWVDDRRRLEARQITLTSVLTKIETFRTLMFKKYDHLLSHDEPLQRHTKLVMNLLLYRLYGLSLSPFHIHGYSLLPPRLRSLLITSAVMVLEIGIQLESDPAFRPWAWYCGAYHQYHAALQLAVEVTRRPEMREADRIWAGLDYVFETPPELDRKTKAQMILGEITNKSAVYQRMRKSRPLVHVANEIANNTASTRRRDEEETTPPNFIPQPPPRTQTEAHQQLPLDPYQMQAQFIPQPMAQYSVTNLNGAPPGKTVYAGVSDGQTLWSVPFGQNMDTSSDSGGSVPPMTMPAQSFNGPEVDLDVLNGFFTNDDIGNLQVGGYTDPFLSLNWEQGI